MDAFRPISAERAAEIRKAIAGSQGSEDRGLSIDQETGELRGTARLASSPEDKRNLISKFDTHYRC